MIEARRGYAAATVPVEGNGNHFGVIYALSTFDTAKYFPLVKNVDIEFVGMARSELSAEAALDDETMTRVEAEAAQQGKTDFTLEAIVADAYGR